MADKDDVFAEGEVSCASREPTNMMHDADACGVRRRRRPRKVVVYYFDSDTEECGDDAVVHAREGNAVASTQRTHSGAKRRSAAGAAAGGLSECTSPEADKLECPALAELEGYSNGHASNTASHGAAAAASCCCTCQARKPVSVDNPRIGSPTPIGFFAFGMTTLLYNVHNAKICQLNMATMGLVVMFGGLTQFLCGFFELINMNTLGCTISTTYGAFWMATAVLFLQPENDYVAMGDHTYTGGFFLLWFFFAGTLFASAFRSPFMCMALFFLVPLNFLLQSIGYFADSTTVAKVAGYEGIIVGALATYLGMAFTLRDVYGRSLLPILFQKNMRYVEW